MSEDLFNIFIREWSVRSIQQAFWQLCVNRGADPVDYANVYEKLVSQMHYTYLIQSLEGSNHMIVFAIARLNSDSYGICLIDDASKKCIKARAHVVA